MNRQPASVEGLVRKAFGLLLEIRQHREAGHLLDLAVTFLNLLLQDAERQASPIVVSIQAVRLREP